MATVGDPNTGFLIGQTHAFPNGPRYAEYRLGGTSLSCPSFAAIMALTDQAAGMHHGFANPTLYAKTRPALDTRPGYDDVTGLGSPNGQAFLDAMS